LQRFWSSAFIATYPKPYTLKQTLNPNPKPQTLNPNPAMNTMQTKALCPEAAGNLD